MIKLFTTILNMSITASYVALAAIGARVLIKKVPKVFSYALWLSVLIRLVCPFSFNSAFSILSILMPGAQANTGAMEYVPYNMGFMQNPGVNVGIGAVNHAVNSSLPSAAPTASVNPMQIIIELSIFIWVFGMVLMLIYSVISYLKVINNIKTATLVKSNIFETDRITTPFLCGFIKPKIYIPVGISENELSYILMHEQTHIKRFDYLIKPFAFLVLSVHWFNPLMWLSFTLMSKDMEMSCDESVIKKMGSDIKGNYSNCLLSLSVKRSGLIMCSPLAFGESNIKSRIKNILNYKKPALWVAALVVVAIVTLLVAFTANPKHVQNAPNTYLGYSIDTLMKNKSPYVGNNSKDIALIDAMSWSAGIIRSTVELQTIAPPYGITIHFNMNDASGISVQGAVSGDAFYRNSIVLFSLIDNVDIINCEITDKTGKYNGAPYSFTFTRDSANADLEKDVREFAKNQQIFKDFLHSVQKLTNKSDTVKTKTSEDNPDLTFPYTISRNAVKLANGGNIYINIEMESGKYFTSADVDSGGGIYEKNYHGKYQSRTVNPLLSTQGSTAFLYI